MEKSEVEYSVRRALRIEFDRADKDRQIEIYKTFKELKFEEDVAETRSDIYADHGIELT